jgi:hypothetical protein
MISPARKQDSHPSLARRWASVLAFDRRGAFLANSRGRESSMRHAACLALALLLAAPAWAIPITLAFTAADGDTAFSGSFVYEGSVSGSGSISGPPYGGSITVPTSTLVSSEVRWIVQTSGCVTGGACAALGLSEPLGGGLTRYANLLFGFTSLPSGDLPDPATLASATTLAFFDLVLDEDGVVQWIDYSGGVTSLSFVPEPRTLSLLAASLVALSALRRRAA